MFIPPGTTMYKKMPAPFPYFDIRLIMSYHMCWQQPASFIAYKMLTPFWLVLSPTVVTWSSQYTRTVLTCHIHWSLGHDSGRYIGFLWISLLGHHFLSRYFTTGSSDISTILMAKNVEPQESSSGNLWINPSPCPGGSSEWSAQCRDVHPSPAALRRPENQWTSYVNGIIMWL